MSDILLSQSHRELLKQISVCKQYHSWSTFAFSPSEETFISHRNCILSPTWTKRQHKSSKLVSLPKWMKTVNEWHYLFLKCELFINVMLKYEQFNFSCIEIQNLFYLFFTCPFCKQTMRTKFCVTAIFQAI